MNGKIDVNIETCQI